jgi:hypothetical protein
MTEPVKKKVKVIEARYIEQAESILLKGQTDNGEINQQIHRMCFAFKGLDGDKLRAKLDSDPSFNKEYNLEMVKTAELLIGKNIYLVFDQDLNDKIKNHHALKY